MKLIMLLKYIYLLYNYLLSSVYLTKQHNKNDYFLGHTINSV